MDQEDENIVRNECLEKRGIERSAKTVECGNEVIRFVTPLESIHSIASVFSLTRLVAPIACSKCEGSNMYSLTFSLAR